MSGGGAHCHQQLAVQPEGGQAIADALFRLGGSGKDELAEAFEFEPLVGGEFGQVGLRSGWLGRHGFLPGRNGIWNPGFF